MGRGLGKVQRKIVRHLEEKAKKSRITSITTVEAYSTANELASALQIRLDIVCQALDSLVHRGSIRVYPNGRKRNRRYGSLILPEISEFEILSSANAILLNLPREDDNQYAPRMESKPIAS